MKEIVIFLKRLCSMHSVDDALHTFNKAKQDLEEIAQRHLLDIEEFERREKEAVEARVKALIEHSRAKGAIERIAQITSV